jgi:hypothetical protein
VSPVAPGISRGLGEVRHARGGGDHADRWVPHRGEMTWSRRARVSGCPSGPADQRGESARDRLCLCAGQADERDPRCTDPHTRTTTDTEVPQAGVVLPVGPHARDSLVGRIKVEPAQLG